MRLKHLLAAAAALATVSFASPDPATAFGYDRHHPDGWGTVRTIHHNVYYPRYAHHYHVDPYAYRYSPRGYYPYNNSGYWRSADTVRQRNHKHYHHWNVQAPRYKYHPSWGHNNSWSAHEHFAPVRRWHW